MDYDTFEADMRQAGYSLQEIEEMWLSHIEDQKIDEDERDHLNALPPLEDGQQV